MNCYGMLSEATALLEMFTLAGMFPISFRRVEHPVCISVPAPPSPVPEGFPSHPSSQGLLSAHSLTRFTED